MYHLQYTDESQCKHDSLYWSLYAYRHNAGPPQSLGRNMLVETISSPLLSSNFDLFVVQFLYFTLLPCHAGLACSGGRYSLLVV